MSWLNSLFGDRFSLFSASFFVRNLARTATVFLVFFTAPESNGPSRPVHVLRDGASAVETLARWMQPNIAAAAPQKRRRARNTRAQAKTSDVASETSPEQATPVMAPLTPYIQIWPQAHSVKSDTPEEMTQLPSYGFMSVAEKSDRLIPPSVGDEEIVQADELSDIDRAAAPLIELQPDGLVKPRAQPVAMTATDGRAAARDTSGDTAVPTNRFSTFAESVKTIPQAPWFDSIMIVLGGAFAAFVGARIFMRA